MPVYTPDRRLQLQFLRGPHYEVPEARREGLVQDQVSPFRVAGLGKDGTDFSVRQPVFREEQPVEEHRPPECQSRVHRPHDRRSEHGPRPELRERREVGPVLYLVRQVAMARTVARDRADPPASHPSHRYQSLAESSLQTLLPNSPGERVEAGACDNTNVYTPSIPSIELPGHSLNGCDGPAVDTVV